ncbi:MAG: carboxypeptidase regulatory-like domain-containing protein [Bryobacterales bacterium]|nr:carboxypeptidase regulatory-like domain-containing protein [Bryobacterales bacterium]
MLAGTVFRDPGFAFAGVQVALEPSSDGKTSVKVKKMKATTDGRGEFSFRVPAVALRYTLRFQAEGFQPETKEIAVSGPERQDIYVTLKPAKGGQP